MMKMEKSRMRSNVLDMDHVKVRLVWKLAAKNNDISSSARKREAAPIV